MRLGIRAQVLLSLAALLVLAFAPLFFAIATVARAGFEKSWQQTAQALGEAVAGHVDEARRNRSPSELQQLMQSRLDRGVQAVGIYDENGDVERQVGLANEALGLPRTLPGGGQPTRWISRPEGARLLVVSPAGKGWVGVLLRAEVRVGPLVRLVALYLGLWALALLVLAYVLLTRAVVQPIQALSRAARRVAEGARGLVGPRQGGRELLELGASLGGMTAALQGEEERLRDNVRQLEAAHQDLARAQQSLIRSERLASVGRLAAGLAHEIGNPIAAMHSFQELLLDGELDDEQRDFVQRMMRETERVGRILRDLLDFARPAGEGAAIDEESLMPTSVGDAIEHVIALVKHQRSFSDGVFSVVLSESLPAVRIPSERLEQVLLNLLLNASDATAGKDAEISLSAVEEGSVVRLAVEDNGGGIEPAVVDTIFEPFVTTKDVGTGTGLGLAVCRGLVEAADGKIWLEDGACGARFVVELPVAPPLEP